MALEIRITIRDKGSFSATHFGDTELLARHGGDVARWLEGEIDNAIMVEESRASHGKSLTEKIVGLVLGKRK